MGAGLGMGMGMMVAQNMGPWGTRPEAAHVPPPPSPPVVEHVWHIADNGKTSGPFSKADLGRMVTEGTLKRDTYVWTPGQDGWKTANKVTELAQLFTIAPPPPPNQLVLVRLSKGMQVKDLYTPVWISGQMKTKRSSQALNLIDGSRDVTVGYHIDAANAEIYENN